MEPISIIIPCAGNSSRFPGMRPKWMLTHPSGEMMLFESIKGLIIPPGSQFYIGILRQQIEFWGITDKFFKDYADIKHGSNWHQVNFVILTESTNSQPETVIHMLKQIDVTGPIFIKDPDNFFECSVNLGNSVCIADLQDMENITPGNKSYIQTNEGNYITNIVEKQIISSQFCCGGYSFQSTQDFIDSYNKVIALKPFSNLYISHLIYEMLLSGKIFKPIHTTNYVDWGTLECWNQYKSQFATLFVDIDGVLVKSSSQYFDPVWGTTEAIQKNIDRINALVKTSKVDVILTTSRSPDTHSETAKELEKLGVKYTLLVCGLLHAKRVIINDFNNTNPYPTCQAINLQRDSDNLADFI